MRALVFALQFRGRGAPVPGASGRRHGLTTAPSQLFRTVLGPAGIDAAVEAVEGESAALEADVQMTGERTFLESGRIRYGGAGAVTFRTVGEGVRGPSAIPGLVHGTVMWEVTGGDGRFTGATGLITSNFTVDASGEVVDDQVARLFLP